jgi:hypothetical protein
MAKQRSIIKIEGTIGDLTFYKSGDGYMVREKGGVSAERIATDPAFQRTRENGTEFSTAAHAGKALRNAVRTLLLNGKDTRVTSRLIKEMMRVIHTDTSSARGSRTVSGGDASLLEGFDFNDGAQLSTTLYVPFTATIDRVSGTLSVAVDGFTPDQRIAAPDGTTHFRLVSMAAEVDFTTGAYTTDANESPMLALDNAAAATLTLANSLTPNSTKHLFLLLGVQFYQEVNGVNYPLKNGAFNALNLVKVSKA